ncbi:MAG: hypothetical protein K6G58_03160 [Lachnospiraceae bacterium]|nr:hypothetical protein [Lachnospiraceae bacterium]
MERITKWLIIAVLALYVASPVDLAPGPIDDAVAILIYMIAARRKRAIDVFDPECVQETVNTDQPGFPS